MSKKQDQGPTTFPEKWNKLIGKMPEFKDTADAASLDDLKKIIVTAEGNLFVIEKEKEADTKLNAAKELVKDYSAGYAEASKFLVAKIKYALFLMEGKGSDLDNRE